MKVYDCKGKEIKKGTKLRRIKGSHGVLKQNDICIVRDFTGTTSGIYIVNDYTHTYDSKYFEVVTPTKPYLPEWL